MTVTVNWREKFVRQVGVCDELAKEVAILREYNGLLQKKLDRIAERIAEILKEEPNI